VNPLLVIAIACVVLREKLFRGFFFLAPVILGSSVILSFPDLDFSFLHEASAQRLRGISYALIASFLWACSLISAKKLLSEVDSTIVAFWRFSFASTILIIMLAFSQQTAHWNALKDKQFFFSVFYMAFFRGLIATLLYQYGLARVSENIAVFFQPVYLIAAVLLNAYILHESLQVIQFVAAAVVLIAVISFK
jgi:drug/metabolite transporter (DMT)-like permease